MVGFWHAFFSMDKYLSQERTAEKKFAKNLHRFSLADKGLGVRADTGNFFLNL
jgi:hypothetical protein